MNDDAHRSGEHPPYAQAPPPFMERASISGSHNPLIPPCAFTDDDRKSLKELERHSTKVNTVALIAGLALSLLGTWVVTGATATRDLALSSAARIAVLERDHDTDKAERREATREAAATHDALVRLTTTVDALVRQVGQLTEELHDRDRAALPRR